MQVKALKTFAGRQGLIRHGMVITVPNPYGNELIRSGLVEAFDAAPMNAAIPEAPETKNSQGDAKAREPHGTMGLRSADRRGGGRGRRSLSLRPDRPSRKQT